MKKANQLYPDSLSGIHAGHLPAEDPHHSAVLRLHAGKEVGSLPVALPAASHGWSHSGAGKPGSLVFFIHTDKDQQPSHFKAI